MFKVNLDPDAVNRSLGIDATYTHLADPVGRTGGTRTSGPWILGTDGTVNSKDLCRHIDWLLDAVERREEAFAELIGTGATADISCYWESLYGHGGPDLSPRQMCRLVRFDLSVGIDIYLANQTEA